ncbi:MAG TPA: hypothetical protein VHU81_04955, partial [Thermoanaerobaculia bacterium]|nr:hypothetical protein [Thermoanaerobaculia bacterium]
MLKRLIQAGLGLAAALVICASGAGAQGAAPMQTQAPTKLLRFPDIRKDKVVFTHAGDLWLAPST